MFIILARERLLLPLSMDPLSSYHTAIGLYLRLVSGLLRLTRGSLS